MKKPKLIFITGISGSGKTTIAKEINKQGYVAFDSKINKGVFRFEDKNGDPPESYNLTDKNWMSKYKWVLNVPMLNQLISQYSNEEQVFLCGRGNIRQHWDLADKVYLLKIDNDTLHARLNDPSRDNVFASDEATQNKLSKELKQVQDDLVKAGAVIVDAKKPIKDVVANILAST